MRLMLTVADTAFPIAHVRAEEGGLPASERLFEDPYAHLFRDAGKHAEEGTRRYLELSFMRHGVRLRTRFIDDFVRDALGRNLKQIVLLGAGFDARGLRMREIAEAGATVFEVDVPSQLERKVAILRAGGVILPAHVVPVPFEFETPDFERALTAALQARGFRAGAGAIFVWEGVIGYLGASEIDQSLRFMARAGGPGTRVVFTFGVGSFEPEGALDRVRRAGFTSFEDLDMTAIWRRYLPGEPHEHAACTSIGVAAV